MLWGGLASFGVVLELGWVKILGWKKRTFIDTFLTVTSNIMCYEW